MTLWAVFTLLLGLAVGLLLPSLLRRFKSEDFGAGKEMAHFKAQLKELAEEEARGGISGDAAEETRREIERRALAAAKSDGAEHVNPSHDRTRLIAVALAGGWVVIGSVVLYSIIGEPSTSSATRLADAPQALSPIDRMAQAPVSSPALQPAQTEQPLADVNTLIDRLAARLEENPGDVAGWQMLGWSHLRMGNFDQAVSAYSRATSLAPQNADLQAAYGEALVQSKSGEIDDTAIVAFDASLAANPDNPLAGYYKGIAQKQAGNIDDAVALWTRALRNTPPDAPWASDLRDRLAAQGQGGLAEESLLPPQSTLRNPTSEEVAAAQEMSASDRQAMIMGMVEGLAERLADNPNDPEGWARLIRSYAVLGDREAAGDALRRARAVFPNGSQQAQMIESTAQSLGLN